MCFSYSNLLALGQSILALVFPKMIEFHKILQGVTIVKPIVYGNVARYFGKKREEDGHTHQWTVYVKPFRNEVSFSEGQIL